MKIKRNTLLLITLGSLLIILSLVVFFKRDSVLLLKNYLTQLSESNPLMEKSKAQIFLEGDKLKISFKIAKKDKGSIAEFAQNLGVTEDFLQGMAFSLDDKTRQRLSSNLPLEVNLDVSGKRLGFSNKVGSTLKSSFVKQDINFATEGAKFSFKGNSDSEFYLEAEEPAPLLKYATESGSINLSEKFSGLFPMLSGLSKIQLTVNGKNINGEIVLK